MSRLETPWILRARRIRVAWQGDVPACGYATFDLVIEEAATVSDAPDDEVAADQGVPDSEITTGDRWAQNALVRIAINDDGTVDVLDRRTGTQYAQCGELQDDGDVGDEYTYSPPTLNPRFGSDGVQTVRVTRVSTGPLRAAFRIDYGLPLAESASADRSSRSGTSRGIARQHAGRDRCRLRSRFLGRIDRQPLQGSSAADVVSGRRGVGH